MTHCRSGECIERTWCFCGCQDCREMQDAEDEPGFQEIQNAEKGEPNETTEEV